MTQFEMRRAANMFAARTEQDIARAEERLRKAERGVSPAFDPGDIALNLSEDEAEELAKRYFQEANERNNRRGVYLASIDSPDQLVDANLDYAAAQRRVEQIPEHEDQLPSEIGYQKCVRLLIETGYLKREWVARNDLVRGKNTEIVSYHRGLEAHAGFSTLRHLLMRADLALAQKVRDSLEAGHVAATTDDLFQGVGPALGRASPIGSRGTVLQLCTAFRESRAHLSSSRQADFQIPERLLVEEIGSNKPVRAVNREAAKKIGELLPKLPSHPTQHYPGVTLRQAAELYREKCGKHADRTAEASKKLQALRAIFDWAVENEWVEANPFSDVKLASRPRRKFSERAKEGYEPFTIDELNKIFRAPLFTGSKDDERNFAKPGPEIVRRHRYWAPLIALWSGLRMTEILQLETRDLKQVDGIWYFEVTDEEGAEGLPRSLKTRQALRDVPLHHNLIKLGLIEWCKEQQGPRLFPEAVAGKTERASGPFSKRFASFLKSLDIHSSRRKVFHSFRNNFNDALRAGGVGVEMREQINGWNSQSIMDKKYGKGYKIKALSEAVQMAKYDGLQLDHLTTKKS